MRMKNENENEIDTDAAAAGAAASAAAPGFTTVFLVVSRDTAAPAAAPAAVASVSESNYFLALNKKFLTGAPSLHISLDNGKRNTAICLEARKSTFGMLLLQKSAYRASTFWMSLLQKCAYRASTF